jgi:rubredoxin/molybdopterin converting factor small subunit
MEKYQCRCQYIYDPLAGDQTQGISAGTSYNDLPDDWICPTCGSEKSHFFKDVGRPNSEMGHPTMKVKVRCFSTLAKEQVCGFRADKEYELYEGSTVHDLTEKLEIPLDAVKIVFRNHREVGFNTVLHAGDRIGFAPVTGGM